MILSILTILAPAFLCIAVGYLWSHYGRHNLDTRQIAQLVTDISSPCLILATIPGIALDQAALSHFAGVSLLAIGSTALLAACLLAITRLPLRDFLPPLVFGNHGNLGLSLCLFAFGKEGLALALIFFTLTTLLHFTVGISLLDRENRIWSTLLSPLTVSMAVALGLLAADKALPDWLQQTCQLLGNTAIPLMLLALGVSLGKLGSPVGQAAGLQLTAFRFLAGLGGGLVVTTLLPLSRLAEQVILVQSAMPAAVFSYLLAVRYERTPQVIAGFVLSSTLLAIPLLFALLWWLHP